MKRQCHRAMKFTLDDQRSGRVGGVIPAFAQGGSAWGECVNDCLPVPEVQRLALQIFKAQLVHGFQLQAICSHTGSMCAKTSCPRHPSGPNTPIGCCRQLAVSLPLARRAVGTIDNVEGREQLAVPPVPDIARTIAPSPTVR